MHRQSLHGQYRASTAVLLLLFAFLSIQTLVPVFAAVNPRASTCTAPSSADKTRRPTFWCSLSATVEVGNNCQTQVTETIVIPWSSGDFNREIPHQANQKITDLSGARITSDGSETSISVSSILPELLSSTANIRSTITPSPLTVILRYTVVNAVTKYLPCDIVDFPDVTLPDPEMTNMVTKWTLSEYMPPVQDLSVTFSLPRDTRNAYVDSIVHQPSAVSTTTTVDTKQPTRTVVVTHKLSPGKHHPAQFIFYLRFGLHSGWATCPNTRNCEMETKFLEGGNKSRIQPGLVIGLCVGLGCVLALAGVAAWIFWGKRQRRRKGGQDTDCNLPKSLQHFAYDTGDEESSQKWKQWTESAPNSMKEEISVSELSKGKTRG